MNNLLSQTIGVNYLNNAVTHEISAYPKTSSWLPSNALLRNVEGWGGGGQERGRELLLKAVVVYP